jgi:mortality factor 4-like protein 1
MPRTPSVLQVLTAFTIACPPDASYVPFHSPCSLWFFLDVSHARRARMLCPDPAFYPLSHSVDVGLVQLFDSALGSRLLYRTERPRYRTLLLAHPDSRPSQLFGAEHLLRLLVLLPELLAESVQVLGNVRFEPIQARLSALVRYASSFLFSLSAAAHHRCARFMVDFSETIFAH